VSAEGESHAASDEPDSHTPGGRCAIRPRARGGGHSGEGWPAPGEMLRPHRPCLVFFGFPFSWFLVLGPFSLWPFPYHMPSTRPCPGDSGGDAFAGGRGSQAKRDYGSIRAHESRPPKTRRLRSQSIRYIWYCTCNCTAPTVLYVHAVVLILPIRYRTHRPPQYLAACGVLR
jgi:hypothetical protein